ncbi:MAG TPA: efflux RND transporter periplasmic adaptor subunit [Vicinamibacterales bacterium]|nr:efflux RND transporter periplasmic adaptor subunit [Vicinamibacterales bacterium]
MDAQDDLSALRIDRAPRREGRPWVKWVVLLVLAVAAGAGSWSWFSRERPIEVEVASVTVRRAGAQASVLNASGYVTARRRATVSSKVTGKIVEVNVEEGMAVREGQVLARLDDANVRAALALMEAQLEAARRATAESEVRLAEAQRTERRREQLRADGLVTEADLDQARAEVQSLQARIVATREQITVAERQVALQKTELDNMVIRAPFSGVALSKDAQPGEMVSPVSAGGGFTRTGISTIVDMSSLEIEVDVNESYINRVTARQPVTAVLDAYPDWQIPGHVITTVPTADRQKATVLVRIGFDRTSDAGAAPATTKRGELDPRILPNMGVKVTFLRDDAVKAEAAQGPTTLVPKAAVRTTGNTSHVFVVRGDAVERRAIQTGGADGDRVEVAAGLSSGDRVVIAPPDSLAEGMHVIVKQGS